METRMAETMGCVRFLRPSLRKGGIASVMSGFEFRRLRV